MPRTARVLLAWTPHHVVQRGHNRASVFAGRADYEYYLSNLREWKLSLGVRLYAYCLMTNHVHLVLEPPEDTRTVGKLMRRIAGRQTRMVNAAERRTGTLWEGRYKASPIQTDAYLLACTRYVELNPVRAGMVTAPEDYPWSSYRQKVVEHDFEWLDMDPCYEALGSAHSQRAERYAEFVAQMHSDAEVSVIRQAIQRNQLTGDERFVEEVARRMGRRIALRGPGRPRKSQ